MAMSSFAAATISRTNRVHHSVRRAGHSQPEAHQRRSRHRLHPGRRPLGRLLIRSHDAERRLARAARDAAQAAAGPAQTISYVLGTLQPTLASEEHAERGGRRRRVAGVERRAGPAIAGRGPADAAVDEAAAPAPGRGRSPAPVFTWAGSRGRRSGSSPRFPIAKRCRRSRSSGSTDAAAHVLAPPLSGRRQWKAVTAKGAYGVDAQHVHDRRVRAGQDDGDAASK